MSLQRRKTLPERKRKDSAKGLRITGIDKKANTIQMQINGCKVTAICREKPNKEVYGQVKDILIRSALQKKDVKETLI